MATRKDIINGEDFDVFDLPEQAAFLRLADNTDENGIVNKDALYSVIQKLWFSGEKDDDGVNFKKWITVLLTSDYINVKIPSWDEIQDRLKGYTHQQSKE